MGRPKTTLREEDEEEDMVSIMKDIQLKVKSLEKIEKSLKSMEAKMNNLVLSVSRLEEENNSMKEEISMLKIALNDREQHSRNGSVRIFGLKLTEEECKDPLLTAKSVHANLLEPILQTAVSQGTISAVPKALQLIEFCHILPRHNQRDLAPGNPSSPANTPTIILRFVSRFMRLLVFKHKKSFFSTNKAMSSVGIVENLTALNLKLIKQLKLDDRVYKTWSQGGRIKYTLVNDKDTVKTLRPAVELPSSI